MFNRAAGESKFTEPAQATIRLARREAQRMHHAYIGTEHILLGLMEEDSGAVVHLLSAFNVSVGAIRAEIERNVPSAPESALPGELPFTPRAKQAMHLAESVAGNLCQKFIGPEHLLAGLILEGSGLAAQVLQKFGVKLDEVGRQAFKTRILQMKIVENVIRPVRSTTAHKRRVREELLAHFTAIYDEEYTRLHESAAALKEAQRRFGNSEELTGELNSALPATERIGYFIERHLGWHAPESVARYMLRFSLVSMVIIAVISGIALTAYWVCGHGAPDWPLIRPLAFSALAIPFGQFLIGVLYFELRNTVLGAFGKPKSAARSALLVILIGLFVCSGSLGFDTVVAWDYSRVFEMFLPACILGTVVGMGFLLLAWFRGPTEIRDTVWALLDLQELSVE